MRGGVDLPQAAGVLAVGVVRAAVAARLGERDRRHRRGLVGAEPRHPREAVDLAGGVDRHVTRVGPRPAADRLRRRRVRPPFGRDPVHAAGGATASGRREVRGGVHAPGVATARLTGWPPGGAAAARDPRAPAGAHRRRRRLPADPGGAAGVASRRRTASPGSRRRAGTPRARRRGRAWWSTSTGTGGWCCAAADGRPDTATAGLDPASVTVGYGGTVAAGDILATLGGEVLELRATGPDGRRRGRRGGAARAGRPQRARVTSRTAPASASTPTRWTGRSS